MCLDGLNLTDFSTEDHLEASQSPLSQTIAAFYRNCYNGNFLPILVIDSEDLESICGQEGFVLYKP